MNSKDVRCKIKPLFDGHSLSNICTKNYWNQTTIVKITFGGWVVYFSKHSAQANSNSISVKVLKSKLCIHTNILPEMFTTGKTFVNLSKMDLVPNLFVDR